MNGARIIPLTGETATALARRLASRRETSDPASGPAAVVSMPGAARTARRAPTPGRERVAAPARAALAFARRRLAADYDVDEFGFDPHMASEGLLPLLRPVYDRWFRVETNGVDHIPADGGALLVANHAGGLWPIDAAMTAMAVHLETGGRRYLRPLAADLLFRTPGVGHLARKAGSTLACPDDADRLLGRGELVGVWPEGFKGIGKPFAERYRLQRFGRGGFVQSAIRARVPIVPVSIIGSEEIHPVLGNARTIARMLDLPYFPLTPTFPWLGPLGLVPLPSKWYIEFGAPIATDALPDDAADDPLSVFELADRVRETIQHSLYRLLRHRASVWR
ncbi:lysophospholipid acyltransferase family protein [Jatrophihabitans fulvus]